jgi:hypothetical protein
MSNKEQFNHNIKKAKRQRITDNEYIMADNAATYWKNNFDDLYNDIVNVINIDKQCSGALLNVLKKYKGESDEQKEILHIQIMSDRLQNNYDNLIEYIDFKKICKDFKLRAGDLTPNQQGSIEQMLREFIKQNSSFYEI